MSTTLDALEPRALWSHFAQLTRLPRPSGHEERAAAWIRELAAARDWEVLSDEIGNVLVRVPATPGRESAPVVVLQGHLDMVGEKNKGSAHDFQRDPIRATLDGEWVRADGTTLGADNGIGVAAALAAATDPSVVHGPLELLFTLDEETGLTGAKNLDASMLRGRVLLNLDSAEDGVVYVGCAGGADAHLDLQTSTEAPGAGLAPFLLEVGGLRGGHSGLNIHENRGNALKVLARVLFAAAELGVPFQIARIAGGDKHNAIPREAEACLFLDPEAESKLRAVLDEALGAWRQELRGVDDGLFARLTPAPDAEGHSVFNVQSRDRVLRLLVALPHGVLAMSRDLEGLVETSSNLAAAHSDGGTVHVLTSSRSSVMPALTGVLDTIRAIGRLAEAAVDVRVGYPGWQPNMNSPVLGLVRDVYTQHWGRPAKITAIHAGLECGLIGERIPGMDMVSFGPQIEGAHSPEERVHVPSVARFWNALKDVLERLSQTA